MEDFQSRTGIKCWKPKFSLPSHLGRLFFSENQYIKDWFTLLNSHDPNNVRYNGILGTQAWYTISVESRLMPFTVKKFKT